MNGNGLDRHVDLQKHNNPGTSDPTKAASRVGLKFAVMGAIVVIGLILLMFITSTRSTKPKTASIASGPVAKNEAPPEMDDEKAAEVALAEKDATKAIMDAGYQKICNALAKEFVDAQTPTREQQTRTLILYSVNRCSGMFIRNADAEKHGLTEAELDAVKEDQDVGAVSIENH